MLESMNIFVMLSIDSVFESDSIISILRSELNDTCDILFVFVKIVGVKILTSE